MKTFQDSNLDDSNLKILSQLLLFFGVEGENFSPRSLAKKALRILIKDKNQREMVCSK